MLNFRKIKLSDREWIVNAVNAGETDGSSYSFGTLYAWGDSYDIEVAEYDTLVLIRGNTEQGRYYVFPSGKGDIEGAVNAIIDECRNEGTPLNFLLLLPENVRTLEKLFPGMFEFCYDRDSSEYVYSVSNMANLPGKKFHGKKGHVNAFFRNHEDVTIDPITEDNIHLCLEIQKQWFSEKEDDEGALSKENIAIEKAVNNFNKLGFEGAVLFADGKPVAFTMGEPLKNNTFCTHYEKTIPDYKDAFPVINNGFTKLMLLNYDYVNREEDTGVAGLRKAKLSYYPEFLLNKYSAFLKNDPMRKYNVTKDDYPSLISLWKTVFGDEDHIIDFFLSNTVDEGNIYAEKQDGKIVSAFYLVDSELVVGNETKKIKYLYAAATLPEYRCQGIMSRMIKFAEEYISKTGYCGICLYPADDKLYKYYEKLGFRSLFSENYYTITRNELEEYRQSRYFNTNLTYSRMREFIPSEAFIKFPSGYLDYARLLAREYGFVINSCFDDEDNVFIIGHREEDTVYIDEAISCDGNYNHILSVISDIECTKIILKTPGCIELDLFSFETKNSGMMYVADDTEYDSNIYLGQPCM